MESTSSRNIPSSAFWGCLVLVLSLSQKFTLFLTFIKNYKKIFTKLSLLVVGLNYD